MLGRDRAFLLLPIGGGRLYGYADIDAPDGQDPTAGVFEKFVELFADFGPPGSTPPGRRSLTPVPVQGPSRSVGNAT